MEEDDVVFDIDDLDRFVPSDSYPLAPVSALSPSVCMQSLPLGSVASNISNDFAPSPWLELRFSGKFETQSDGEGVASPVNLPVRKGLSSTQFHPGAVARGVSPNVLLHSAGALLQNGKARRNDHQLSQELKRERGEQLDIFISHSWTVRRWKKFIVMAIYFNGQQAAILSLLVQAATCAAVCTGMLPVLAADSLDAGVSPWCFIFGSLAFWLCVLLWHELMLLGRRQRRPMAFFDTVCIDQSDEEKKREGIEAITAYLCHSRVLFVVLSEVYLQRIWTVFELVAFLAVNDSQYEHSHGLQPQVQKAPPVVVQPVALAILIPGCFLFQMTRTLGDWARYSLTNTRDTDGTLRMSSVALSGFLILVFVLMITYLVTIIKGWGQQRAQLVHQVNTFSFSSAKCHHEPDRREISLAVKYLAERTGLVDSEASLKEAEQALESHARRRVWPAMAGALSPAGIPPWDAWLIAVPVIAVALDDVAMSTTFSTGLHVTMTSLIAHAAVALNFPIVIALVSISSCRPRRARAYEFFATVLCVAATFVFISTRGWINAQLFNLARGQGIRRLDMVCSVTLVIQALVLWCCYGSGISHLRRCCRR